MNITEITIKTALKQMFNGSHFSICTIDKLLKLSNSIADPKVYEHMNALHCVHYKDMPEELRQWLLEEVVTMFSGNGFDLDMLDFVKQPQQSKVVVLPVAKDDKRSFLHKLLN